MGLILVIGITSLLGGYVMRQLKSRMTKYAQMPLASGLTGAQVAQNMLADYGLTDVRIVEGKGFLTDHYDPRNQTITLSPAMFQGRSLAAAAVAAHETGHAVQHADEYAALKLRSALVPLVKSAGMLQRVLLIAVVFLFTQFPQLILVLIGTYLLTTLFSLVTLPVEYDASRRALDWLAESPIAADHEQATFKDALKWAGSTYVVQALAAIAIIGYFLMSYLGGRK